MVHTKAGTSSIVIVSDEDEQRRGQVLNVILRPFFQIEATSFSSLVHSLGMRRHNVDVILYDLASLRDRGLEGVRSIKDVYPGEKIVLLIPHPNANLFAESICYGAEGSVVYPCDARALVAFLYDLVGR